MPNNHHDHHDDHDHAQSHDHSGHSHDIPLATGPADSLFSQIDVPHVSALNAQGGGDSGQKVIKDWEGREDETRWCESDTDDTLIIKIPFISSVSIRSITVKAGPSGQTPRGLYLYRDRPELDFSDAEGSEPTQVLELVQGRQGLEYQVKAAKFASLTSLTLYVPGNMSAGNEETTRLYYVGLRGRFNPLPNRPGVIIYEAAARPTDHKLSSTVEGATFRPGY